MMVKIKRSSKTELLFTIYEWYGINIPAMA